MLLYQLIATDDEGDVIQFELNEEEFELGDLNMTVDGQ